MYQVEGPTSGLQPEVVLCTQCGKHERQYPYAECVFSRIARGHDSTCLRCKLAGKHLCTGCNECKTICTTVRTA